MAPSGCYNSEGADFLFARATSQSPCLHETLALLSASGACLATTETECRGRDTYEKLAERVSHSLQESCIKRFTQDWMMSDVLLSVSFYVDE